MTVKSITLQKSSPDIVRWWDLPAALLLCFMLSAAYSRLIATKWTSDLDILQMVTYFGLAAGLALGQSRFSSSLALIFASLYGSFVVPWQIGLTLGEAIPWLERLEYISLRFGVIFDHLSQGRPVPDNLLFLLIMCVIFWALGANAGFTLVRRAKPWRIILPMGIALVMIHSYDAYLSRRIWYLVIYLFFSLLLLARLNYLHNQRRWKITNTYMPPHLGMDFLRITTFVALGLLFLSWAVPARANAFQSAAEAWYRIKQPFNDIRDYLDNAFASLSASVGLVNDYYGADLALGRGNRLSDQEIFSVQPPSDPPAGVRFYWRARIYDKYESGQWKTTLDVTQTINPEDDSLPFSQYTKRTSDLYSFFFTTALPIATLFTAPQPQWINRPVKGELAYNPDGTVDIAVFRANPTLRKGETYTVRSSLSGVTVKDMRQAGRDYPDWITTRYLQLSPSISARTIQLAHDLTDKLETPYDQVVALTNYLRNNIEYVETIPEIPFNQEPIDWFLFEHKKGFCNYYASTEVILLRAVGIPARLAVGYTQGETRDIEDVLVVLQRDAHAWPEVFFPNIGWVEFEPTVSQPTLVRPTGEATSDQSGFLQSSRHESEPPAEPDTLKRDTGTDLTPQAYPLAIIISISLITLLFVSLPIFMILRRTRLYERIPPIPVIIELGFRRIGLKPPESILRWAHISRLSPFSRAYHEINMALGRIGKKPRPNETPSERVVTLSAMIPETLQPAQRLLAEYQLATYSRHSASFPAAKEAAFKIRSISYRVFFRQLLSRRKIVRNAYTK